MALGALAVFLLWGRAAWRRSPPPVWTLVASELLGCLEAGGERELEALAAEVGQTPTELLGKVLREATLPHASQLPSPPLTSGSPLPQRTPICPRHAVDVHADRHGQHQTPPTTRTANHAAPSDVGHTDSLPCLPKLYLPQPFWSCPRVSVAPMAAASGPVDCRICGRRPATDMDRAARPLVRRGAASQPALEIPPRYLNLATPTGAADLSLCERTGCGKERLLQVACLHAWSAGGSSDVRARPHRRDRIRRPASPLPSPQRRPARHLLQPHPTLGRRIGEATNPGLPTRGDHAHDDVSRRRSRALHALAQMRLLPEPAAPDSGAETLSDTLSAHTAIASPRRSLSPARAEPNLVGEAAPTAWEATPGFTPPGSPGPPAAPAPGWLDAPPPAAEPSERNSWLFVPLLHAGAGFLTDTARRAWRAAGAVGSRFEVRGARRGPSGGTAPATSSVAPRAIRTLVDCDTGGELRSRHPLEAELDRELQALPAAPLPLPAAVSLSMGRDGYIPARTQSALLQTFCGLAVATAAQSMADDVRGSMNVLAAVAAEQAQSRRRRGGRGRGNRGGRRGRGDEAHARQADDDSVEDAGQLPTQPAPASRAVPSSTHLESLQALDLAAELRQRVHTLQSPPRQLRGLLRHAFRVGLETIRDAPTPEQASVGWKLFLLAPRMLLYRAPGATRVASHELRRREALFLAGKWLDLLNEAAAAPRPKPQERRARYWETWPLDHWDLVIHGEFLVLYRKAWNHNLRSSSAAITDYHKAMSRATTASTAEVVKSSTTALPALPAVSDPAEAALAFQDWVEVSSSAMGDISERSGNWWSSVLQVVEKTYSEWLAATPLERLGVAPPTSHGLCTGGWARLNARAASMLLSAMGDEVKNEMELPSDMMYYDVYRLDAQPSLESVQTYQKHLQAEIEVIAAGTRASDFVVGKPGARPSQGGAAGKDKTGTASQSSTMAPLSLPLSSTAPSTASTTISGTPWTFEALVQAAQQVVQSQGLSDGGSSPEKTASAQRKTVKISYIHVCSTGRSAAALLDSGATHCLRSAYDRDEWQQSEEILVELAGGSNLVMRMSSTGTLLMPPRSTTTSATTTATAAQTIVPVGQLVKVLGYTLVRQNAAFYFACPQLCEAEALSLIARIEDRKRETLENLVEDTKDRVSVAAQRMSRGWQDHLLEYVETGSMLAGEHHPWKLEYHEVSGLSDEGHYQVIELDLDVVPLRSRKGSEETENYAMEQGSTRRLYAGASFGDHANYEDGTGQHIDMDIDEVTFDQARRCDIVYSV
ncbi:unnamed protein product [Symbiodinium sp. CCMP2592]|nr:unnamed protein product [Symbiodinium sp. CCMP2592]